MGEWKSLKIESGSGGFKELYREAGSGGWKELDWDYLLYDGFESAFSGWSGSTAEFAQSSDYHYIDSYSLRKTGNSAHKHIYKALSTQNISAEVRIYNSNVLDRRGGPIIGIVGGNYIAAYVDPGDNLLIPEFNNANVTVETHATVAIGTISSSQWIRVLLTKNGTTLTAYAYLENGTLLATCSDTISFTTGMAGIHMYDQNGYMDEFKVEGL